jgi:hypothetical protein
MPLKFFRHHRNTLQADAILMPVLPFREKAPARTSLRGIDHPAYRI